MALLSHFFVTQNVTSRSLSGYKSVRNVAQRLKIVIFKLREPQNHASGGDVVDSDSLRQMRFARLQVVVLREPAQQRLRVVSSVCAYRIKYLPYHDRRIIVLQPSPNIAHRGISAKELVRILADRFA